MIKKRYRHLSVVFILLLVIILLLATACSTPEVSIELTQTQDGPPAVSSTSAATQVAMPEASTPDATPTPEPTSTPMPVPAELRVAFVKDANVWLWSEVQTEAMPLTEGGDVGGVRISDDGEIAAFTRGDELWMVRSDGADERPLVTEAGFAAMEPRESFEFEVVLHRFDWVPGTHVLAFNTRLRTQIGLALNDDLRLVDADTLAQTVLLPPSEGGEFYYSPNGRQVAVVTPGSISLLSADGSDRRDVFTYTPVRTYSEFQYYAQPVWAADSSAVRVAIPPVDPVAQPPASTGVWHIPTDGTPAGLISSITAAPGSQFAFSPDLSHVAYLASPEGAPPGDQGILLVTDLTTDEAVQIYPEVYDVYGWAPDGRRVAFLTASEHSRAWIGGLDGGAVHAHGDDDTFAIDVTWVDARHYLYLAQGAPGWNLLLGEIGGPVAPVAAVAGFPPAYDFAAPDTSTSVSAGEPGDDSPPVGLVYQASDGLWHVSTGGQLMQILEKLAASQYTTWPAISPDDTQIVYTEADELWLIDVASGERRNLTQTPDRSECCAQWWPGQPDLILFSSWLLDPESEGPNYGFPTVVSLDGSGYAVLDESQVSYALPAPSPDGQTVAYDRAGQAWLYRSDIGPEPLDLTLYGLSSDPDLRVVSPSWSPDGWRLAWVIGGCRAGECQTSIGVFDLEAQAVRFLHPYSPVGMGGQPPAPVWSPDGRWLAFTAVAMDREDAGLWVARVDGQQEEEYRLATGHGRAMPNPVWSPDGRWLAFTGIGAAGEAGHWLAEVGVWELRLLDLPPDAYIMDWISLVYGFSR